MWANSNIWRNNEWDFSRTYIKDINSGIQELQPTSSRENTDKTILRHFTAMKWNQRQREILREARIKKSHCLHRMKNNAETWVVHKKKKGGEGA